MNAKMSQQLTLLGLGAMAFYGIMLSTGNLSIEVMPQFLVSAVIFLSSGRIMRAAAKALGDSETEENERPKRPEADWPWLTGLLNWTSALLVIGIMAIILMKPTGISFIEALNHSAPPAHYSAEFVP
jgi:type IV secretory pathway VirB2 component (pilin)